MQELRVTARSLIFTVQVQLDLKTKRIVRPQLFTLLRNKIGA